MKLKLLFLGLHLGFCFQVYAVKNGALGNGAGQNNLEQDTIAQLEAIIASNNESIASLKAQVATLEFLLKVKEQEVEVQRKINHLLEQDAEKWATQSNALALYLLKVLKGKPGPHFSIKRPEHILILLEKLKKRFPEYN